jgi:hypothetical protein
MSGLETLVVIGILANVAAIARGCNAIIGQSFAFHKSKDAPQALRNLQVVLPLVELTLEKTHRSADTSKLDARTCEALIPVVKACESRLEELRAKLQDLIPGKDASGLKMIWKRTSAMVREKEINDLANEIMRSHLLIHQAGAVVPSSDEVTAVTSKVSGKLDGDVEDMIKQLLVRDHCPFSLPFPSAPLGTI